MYSHVKTLASYSDSNYQRHHQAPVHNCYRNKTITIIISTVTNSYWAPCYLLFLRFCDDTTQSSQEKSRL